MNNRKWINYGFIPLLAVYAAGCAHTESQRTTAGETVPPGFVTDSAGKVVRDASNDCVHSSAWTGNQSLPQCGARVAAATPPAPVPTEQAKAQTPTGELPPPVPTETVALPADEPTETAAAPRRVERIYLGADTYFEFNQAELRPQAHTTLDKIVAQAKDGQNPTIEIVGHADQIGSEDYNLTLSQRRADAVRAYFIQQGLPEDSIRVEARGESDPIVQCEGKQGQALVSCLQPNRRSEIIFSALESPDAP